MSEKGNPRGPHKQAEGTPGASTAPVVKLKPAPYNPRTISKQKLAALGRAMKEYGPLGGFVFNRRTGFLVGGHQRLKHVPPEAEITIEIEHAEPTTAGTVAEGFIVLDGERWDYREVDWPAEKERAANIAANQHGGEWDLPMLVENLKALAGTDLELTGFTGDEYEDLLAQWNEEGQEEEDGFDAKQRYAEIREDVIEGAETRTKAGDVWAMGDHRLAVGDSTDPAVIKRALGHRLADMIFTDPPYNVNISNSDGLTILNDRQSWQDFSAFLLAAFKAMLENTRPGGPAYVCYASSNAQFFHYNFTIAGWTLSQSLVWVKNSIVMGHSDYHWQHESILYGWRPGAPHPWHGHRNKTTVLDFERDPAKMKKDELLAYAKELREALESSVMRIPRPRVNDLHPTMKPIALIAPRIRNSSSRGGLVLDPFAGSGSTMVAAHKTGRLSALVELDPVYADVILERWEALTGIRAEKLRAGNGADRAPFDAGPMKGTADHAPAAPHPPKLEPIGHSAPADPAQQEPFRAEHTNTAGEEPGGDPGPPAPGGAQGDPWD